MKTFKVLSLLLSYPTQEVQNEAPALKAVLRDEALLPAVRIKALADFIDQLAEQNLLDVQERYVTLFDRSRALSLHLFEHVHGESRDRGQSMVDLLELYQKKGLDVGCSELPDYLPLYLEFLSTQPLSEARALLLEPLHILAAIRTRLEERKSPYKEVFRALEALAGQGAEPEKVKTVLASEPDVDADDQVALDAAWEEAEVRFGPEAGEGDCPKVKNILETMNRDPKPKSVRAGSR